MKPLHLLLAACLYLWGMVATAAERLDAEVTKALIVRQIIGLVEWQEAKFNAVSDTEFVLCTYRDRVTGRRLAENLESTSIRGRKFKVNNHQQVEQLAACHALYLKQPGKSESNELIDFAIGQQILLIAEGKKLASQGYAVSLYLSPKNTFDIEINPDVLLASHLSPNPNLLSTGKTLTGELGRKLNLLRSLINYTDWSQSATAFANAERFELCLFQDPSLAPYLEFFGRDKAFKNKPLNISQITAIEQAADCHAILVGNVGGDTARLLAQRAQNGILLVGNQAALGDKGVHYNLAVSEEGRRSRFEINLLAFEKTAHTPNFELLNSAFIIKTDYAEYSRMLHEIIQYTRWPASVKSKPAKFDIEVCIADSSTLAENFKYFLAAYQTQSGPVPKNLQVRELTDSTKLAGCSVLVKPGAHGIAEGGGELTEKLSMLFITANDGTAAKSSHYHFNITPKAITFSVNLETLTQGGYSPAPRLLESAQVVEGDGA